MMGMPSKDSSAKKGVYDQGPPQSLARLSGVRCFLRRALAGSPAAFCSQGLQATDCARQGGRHTQE